MKTEELRNLLIPKKVIAKEIFAPVKKKFVLIKIIPLYEDESWSIGSIDCSSLNNTILTLILRSLTFIQNMLVHLLRKINQEKLQHKHSRR